MFTVNSTSGACEPTPVILEVPVETLINPSIHRLLSMTKLQNETFLLSLFPKVQGMPETSKIVFFEIINFQFFSQVFQ